MLSSCGVVAFVCSLISVLGWFVVLFVTTVLLSLVFVLVPLMLLVPSSSPGLLMFPLPLPSIVVESLPPVFP